MRKVGGPGGKTRAQYLNGWRQGLRGYCKILAVPYSAAETGTATYIKRRADLMREAGRNGAEAPNRTG